MVYDERSLAADVTRLHGAGDYVWQRSDTRSDSVGVQDIIRYCWAAYSKAFGSAGYQVIGRTDAINGDIRATISQLLAEQQTQLTAATRGNVLQMDKWCVVMNDCWLLGGVHRRATFMLQSQQSWQNLWDPARGGLVVTARELIGLRMFGYVESGGQVFEGERSTGRTLSQAELDRIGWEQPMSVAHAGYRFESQQTYVLADQARALRANLLDYDREVRRREAQGPLGVTDLVRGWPQQPR